MNLKSKLKRLSVVSKGFESTTGAHILLADKSSCWMSVSFVEGPNRPFVSYQKEAQKEKRGNSKKFEDTRK